VRKRGGSSPSRGTIPNSNSSGDLIAFHGRTVLFFDTFLIVIVKPIRRYYLNVMTKITRMPKANILAVDDYPANLIALEAVLNSEFNIITANSGAESISILESRKDIDVILMDLQMPKMDGYETARRIKKIKDCEDIPIIFVTAIYKEEAFIKKGYEAGGIDYFSKPFDPEILKMKVGIYASFRQKEEVLRTRERQILETEALLKTGRKLSAALESLSVGVLIADVKGRICQINKQVSHICEAAQPTDENSYGEMLRWWDASGPMIKEKNGPLYRAIHSGETSHNQPIHINCLGGLPKVILGSASPLLGLDGHIVGAVVVLQDVTESKKIEEDLEGRITKLVSASIQFEESISPA
jgi:CheY-like chemotaxis protein